MSYIIVIALTVLITLLIINAKKKEMPNPFCFKNIKKNGIFSDDWMDWLQKNYSDKNGTCLI